MSMGEQHILQAMERLPDDATLEDAIERLCFLAKVEEGIRQSETGELVLLSGTSPSTGATADAASNSSDDATSPLPGLVAKPAAWRTRFLLDLGRSDQERDPNHTLEIVLSGSDERRR